LRRQCFQITTPSLEALDARELDELALHHLEHGRARDAHEARHQEGAERDHGQDEVLGPAHPARRQPAQLDAEHEDQQDAEPEARHGDAEHRHSTRHAVQPAAAVKRRHHAERNAEQHAEQQRPRDQHSVLGRRSKKASAAGWLHADRGAEVAVHGLADEDGELLGDRPVEAERPGQRGAVLGGGILRQHEVDRIAGQPAEHEHDRRHQAEQHHALHQAARDEALHGRGCGYLLPGLLLGRGMRSNTSPSSCRPGSPRIARPSWC
jgi:hypothetical protein